MHRNRGPRDSRPASIDGWKQAHEIGIAGALCDRVVATRPVPPRLLRAIFDAPDDQPSPLEIQQPKRGPITGRDGLTVRKPTAKQLDVIRLIADGMDHAEIAAALWITTDCVNQRIARAFKWTGARNRAHLIALAIRRRWIA